MHCTIYACIDIDKQSSYSLALMSRVKAFNTLGDYRSLRHHFTQCVWPDYWSWILSSTSYIMNSWSHNQSYSIPPYKYIHRSFSVYCMVGKFERELNLTVPYGTCRQYIVSLPVLYFSSFLLKLLTTCQKVILYCMVGNFGGVQIFVSFVCYSYPWKITEFQLYN